jgi:hypothetical protein
VSSESSGSKKVAAIVALVAIAAIAIIIAVFTLSYNPAATSPTTFSDPTPMIELIHDGQRFEGQLLSASVGVREMPQSPDAEQDITSISGDVINLQQRAIVNFEIIGESSLQAEPDTFSVNAYTESGNPIGVLAISREGTPYELTVDLPQGSYIILVTATWLAEPMQSASGYVTYGYRVNVM